MPASTHEVTLLLQRIAAGDRSSVEELLSIVYAQLHAIAQGHFRSPADGARTLQPTALVHEAFLKIFAGRAPAFGDREHFLAVAASAMRSVLVDSARAKKRNKRGGGAARVPLEGLLVPFEERALDILALDDALLRLARVSRDAARVVELRFFGGLDQADVAHVMGVSVSSVERDWRTARAWLRRDLSAADAGGAE